MEITANTRRGRVLRIYASSIGAKAVVAVTGLLLFGFVMAHLLGNLQLWEGREAMNGYAAFLQSQGPLLWVMRGGLLGVFVVHIATAARLVWRNRGARPTPYAREATVKATWASRHMLLSGLVVLAFVIYHLLHFTFHVGVDVGVDAVGRPDVYGMVVAGFQNPLIAISYVFAMLLLGVHLIHATRSLFQTFGWDHTLISPLVRWGAPALTLLIVAGNVALPFSVLLGFVK